MLPNSEMNHPEYIGGCTGSDGPHAGPVLPRHPIGRPAPGVLRTGRRTATLPRADWLRCQFFSWAVQTFHCLSLTQVIALFLYERCGISYRSFYEGLLRFAERHPATVVGRARAGAVECFRHLLEGRPWGVIDPRFGPITWPPEEAAFLQVITDRGRFYAELLPWVLDMAEGADAPRAVIEDVFRYQAAVVCSPGEGDRVVDVSHNVHEVLEAAYLGGGREVAGRRERYTVKVPKTYTDLGSFAREVVWYGRKGGRFRYLDVEVSRVQSWDRSAGECTPAHPGQATVAL
jgi:hypothetical protein